MKKIPTYIFCFVLCLCKAGNTTGFFDNSYASSKKVYFTENKGQVCNQYHKPNPSVLFGTSAGNVNIHLKKRGLSYQLYKQRDDLNNYPAAKQQKTDYMDICRIDVEWKGCNTNIPVEKIAEVSGHTNYYLEHVPEGITHVKSFEEIMYKNVYPGINAKFYSHKGLFKYDFIVQAGANYKNINLEFKGASLRLTKLGELEIITPIGTVTEGAPLVYQNGNELKAEWKVSGNCASFLIHDYDNTKELIIDPVVRVWGTYYGATGTEDAIVKATPSFVYIAGNTSSSTSTNIATVGTHQTTYGGSGDVYLARFTSTGIRLWGSYYGGVSLDNLSSLEVDNNNDAYIGGSTQSSTVMASTGGHQTVYSGNTDGFLAKFSSTNGTRIWGTYYGGNQLDYVQGISTDASGNVYISGTTASGSNISTAGTYQTGFGGSMDGYLVKFNSSGVRQWGTYYGGSGLDQCYDCKVDASGNIYIVGSTDTPSGLSSTGAHQTSFGGGTGDGFIAKFNNTGTSRLWGTYLGGGNTDEVYNVAVDLSSNVFVTGFTNSNNNIGTPGTQHPNQIGGMDAFLNKFDATGVRLWGTYIGQNGSDYPGGKGLAINNQGDPVVCGYVSAFTGSNNISTNNSHQISFGGGSDDAFIMKFNTNTGLRIWGSFYGASASDKAQGVSIDNSGIIYMSGTTMSTFNISTLGAHQFVYGGSGDGFLVRFQDCPEINLVASVSNPSVCYGGSVTLQSSASSTLSHSWTGPNSFNSSLSQPTINPASPLNIGTYTLTVNSTTTGCSETSTVYLWVYNAVNIGTTFNNTTVCQGNSVVLTATTSGNTYTWLPMNTAASSVVVSPSVNTTYTVQATQLSNGCSNYKTIPVVVNPNPTVTVLSNPSSGTICAGQSATLSAGGANNYTWQPGSYTSSTSPYQVTPTVTTIYTVTGTSAQNCIGTNTIQIQVFSCSTGMVDSFLNSSLLVYPNPFESSITIEVPFDGNIIITDAAGKVVLRKNNLVQGKQHIDCSDLPKGVYLLEFESKNVIHRCKLLK